MRKTPVNQVRLTNVAIVRLKKSGIRFELACYKNKVINWRNKVESDINEVLQIEQIFTNVSKGTVAKKAELKKGFPGKNEDEITIEILEKGELQVSDLERDAKTESLKRDIANWVCKKTLNTKTKRSFPVSTILKAMDDNHFKVNDNQNAKVQGLRLIKQLQKDLPIRRIKIGAVITYPFEHKEKINTKLTAYTAEQIIIEKESIDTINKLEILCEPQLFKELAEFLVEFSGSIEILDHKAELVEEEEKPKFTGGHQMEDEPKIIENIGEESKEPAIVDPEDKKKGKKGKLFKCNTCIVEYTNAEEHRAHFKSTWHKMNCTRKLEEKELLTFEQFENCLLEETLAYKDEKSEKKKKPKKKKQKGRKIKEEAEEEEEEEEEKD